MFITVLAPEFLLAKAVGDLKHARLNQVELQRLAEEDGVPWTLTHTLFANMGGFVIRRAEEDNNHLDSDTSRSSFGAGQDSLLNLYHVMAVDIISLRKSGKLPKLPCITTEEINDKRKANIFIKAIAVTQILWMVVQILLRTARQLAVTQLEIGVLAFSVCAIFIYFLYWQKPKDVKVPFTLMVLPIESFDSNVRYLWWNYGEAGSSKPCYNDQHSLGLTFGLSPQRIRLGNPIPNDYSAGTGTIVSDNPRGFLLIGICIGCFVFGGIHVAAWGFHFPTVVDTILWRVASLLCAIFPLLYVLSWIICSIIEEMVGWLVA